jgi:hypothetical protein
MFIGTKSKPQPDPKPEPAPIPEPAPEPAPAPAPEPQPQINVVVNGVATPINIDGVRWDRRCGPDYPSIQDGVTSGKCDPNSPYPCCSEFGWCGPESDYNEQDHCSCDNCVDFRTFPAFDIAGKPGVNGGGGGSGN